jgi:hypothetical protein
LSVETLAKPQHEHSPDPVLVEKLLVQPTFTEQTVPILHPKSVPYDPLSDSSSIPLPDLKSEEPFDELAARSMPRKIPYDSLPDCSWFRLLLIKPGNQTEDIVCTLTSLPRAEAKDKYEALSYTWHSQLLPRQNTNKGILCNGISIQVGDNLYFALWHLRYHAQPRIIWVDQLCINQADAKERNEQVQCMNLVYSHAWQTVVWLGLGQDSKKEREALSNICGLVNTWNPDENARFWVMDDETMNYEYGEPREVDGSVDISFVQRLGSLFTSTW